MEQHAWSRRNILRSGLFGAAALVAAPAVLAACGDSDSDAASGEGGKSSAPDFGTLDFQLSWVKNNSFAGIYIADQEKYFADAGFDKVNLLAGGPNVAPDAVVAAGTALLGTTNTDTAASAILAGSGTIVIASHFLTNPFCVISLPDAPIKEPADLEGKKIGVTAYNETVWAAFLEAAGVDASKVTVVPVQYDPSPLTSGEIDGYVGFVNDQPASLKAQGVDVEIMMFADFGYQLVQESVIVKKSALDKQRDAIKAALVADIKGWRKSVEDPDLGPMLTTTIYGKDLGITTEQLEFSSAYQKDLVYPSSAATNGVLLVTEDLQTASITSLGLGGIDITAEDLFDMSLMEEIYQENPELTDAIS